MGIVQIKNNMESFSTIIKGVYKRKTKQISTRNISAYIYTTKTESTSHIKSVSGNYVILGRSQARQPVWTILITLKPVNESQTFYFIRMD